MRFILNPHTELCIAFTPHLTPYDELVAVYALETSPMVLDVTTSFYQDAVGGTLGNTINPAFFGAFPSLEFDSWFTIGSADSNGTSDIQQVGMDDAFALFETGAGFNLMHLLVDPTFLYQMFLLMQKLVLMEEC